MRRGFVPRALVFGSIAAALRYNVMSRIITSLTDRCLVIPLVGYLGDFSAIARMVLGELALEVFTRYRSIMGIQLNPGKSAVGQSVTSIGILGASHKLRTPISPQSPFRSRNADDGPILPRARSGKEVLPTDSWES